MRTDTEHVEVQPILEVDATDVPYRELNTRLRNAAVSGMQKMVIRNVDGQRYIGTNLGKPVEVEIHGTRAMTWALSWTGLESSFMEMCRTAAGTP